MQFMVKWCRAAGTPKTPRVRWLEYTFDVIEVRELPESTTCGQRFDHAEMTVETDVEIKGIALESLQSGRVFVAEATT